MDLSGIFDPDTVGTMLISFIPRVLAALLIFGLFWLLQRLTRPSLRAAFQRASLDETLIRMLVHNLYRPALLILGGIMAAGQIGINVTALLAGISVAGVAFGFAAQDTLANVISGFLIFWDKPFTVGDFVTVQDQYGRVVDITMRSTRIRTVQNTYVIIPNRSIIDAVMVNHTKHGEVRVEVPVGIAYKESIPEARRVLLQAVTGLEGVAADPAPDVVATVLGSSSVDLLVRVWVEDSALERPVFYRTLEASKLALDAAGIQIPYHHLQLFLDKVEEPVWQRLSSLRLAGGGQSG